MIKPFKYILLALLISACEPTIGPCVHINEEPILSIQSVHSIDAQTDISSIVIFDVFIDGVSISPSFFIDDLSENISVEDSLITCSIPCGFGTMEGTYLFSVTADGYQESTITQNVAYGTSGGSCPSSSSNGTKISFSLIPE